MVIHVDSIQKCDILVIGGGLAGCLAALAAKEELGPEGKVVIVDKGYLSRSGQSPWAAGSYCVFYPELDDKQVWLEEMITQGEFLNDQYWCQQWLEKGHKVADKVDGWTNCFLRDGKGEIVRMKRTAHLRTWTNLFKSFQMMDGLRRRLVQQKVQIVDRVMVTDLLKDGDRVIGTFGFNFQQNKIHLFLAKAVILAASGCAFKQLFIAVGRLTGDVQAAAYEAGVEFTNLENIHHNTTWIDHDVVGMGLFLKLGKLVNRLGEEFMWDYYPAKGHEAPYSVLNVAMAREVHEGRGPVYLDVRQATRADRELAREILPSVFKMFDRAGQSPFDSPKEWIPAALGTLGPGGGIFLNSLKCETNVSGVLAAGDICWQPVHGEYAFGGLNIGFAALSGDISGRAAARLLHDSRLDLPQEPPKGLISDMLRSRLTPLTREKGLNPEDVVQEIRKAIVPYNVALIKHAVRLKKALERIQHVRNEMVPHLKAGSVRELSQVLEARSMSIIVELILKASLVREESRGYHFREDFPYTDNENWLKLIILRRGDNGQVVVRTQPVETPFIKPSESKSLPPGTRKPH